ncbi:YncE family protein [Sorangium sp. So ce429]
MSATRTRRALVALGVCPALLGCGRGAPPPPSRAEAAAPAAPPAQPEAAQPDAAPSPASRVERDGLSIAFTLRALEGDAPRVGAAPAAGSAAAPAFTDAVVEFTLRDATTGAPVRGLSPLAWMSRRGAGGAAGPSGGAGAGALDAAGCRAKIKTFMAGLLSVRPEVDMNAYFLWTLNRDSTLSVINPQVALGRTKLRSVVSLAGPGVSLALHPDRDRLYVTLRGGRGLAVVDTRRALVKANVPVGEEPTGVAVAPDGRTVWVGNDGDGTVSVVDARSTDVLRTLRVGPGHHEIAFAGGGRAAWITSQRGEAVAVVDVATLEPLGEVAVGEGAVSIAASDEAGVVYVANAERAEVAILDAARRAVAGRVPLKPGLGAVRFDPRGRFAFALNPAANEVSLLDASTGAVAHTLSGFAAPDAVTFTDAFAYVRNRGAARVSLIDRAGLGGPAAPPVVHVAVGQDAPAAARPEPPGPGGLAAVIAPMPEGNGAVIASPADKALYFYVEGMMAPIGTFSNYGREPRAVLVEDRSLEEVRPGVYATTARLGAEGLHDVALLLDRPRAAVCLEATVAPARCPEGAPYAGEDGCDSPAPGITLEPLFEPDLRLEAGAPATLRFRATAKAAAPALDAKEMEIMIVRFPAGYRWNGAPRPEGDGVFSVAFTPPEPGEYRFLAAAPQRGLPLGALSFVPLRVLPPRAGAPGGGAR